MKIEIYEITSEEDKVYQELLEQYKTNPELKALLDEQILPFRIVLMGDVRLIKILKFAIKIPSIKVYLVKDIDSDIFLWVIGIFNKFDGNEKISMYPLLEKQSKELQLEIKDAIIKKGLINQ
jgi:hypothetical protein